MAGCFGVIPVSQRNNLSRDLFTRPSAEKFLANSERSKRSAVHVERLTAIKPDVWAPAYHGLMFCLR